jgi:hypothetical protein
VLEDAQAIRIVSKAMVEIEESGKRTQAETEQAVRSKLAAGNCSDPQLIQSRLARFQSGSVTHAIDTER